MMIVIDVDDRDADVDDGNDDGYDGDDDGDDIDDDIDDYEHEHIDLERNIGRRVRERWDAFVSTISTFYIALFSEKRNRR